MQEIHYKIEKPKRLETRIDVAKLVENQDVMHAVVEAQLHYLPWKEFRRKSWVPEKKEEAWELVKLMRRVDRRPTAVVDEGQTHYTFDAGAYAEFLHQVDMELGGMFLGVQDFSEGDKRRIIRRNLIEESIASSQLEGANTSRQVAKKMLAEARQPRNKSEQMIVNNHETMRWIEEELKNHGLSLDLLFELHRRITRNTIDEEHQGRLRQTLDENRQRLVVKPWDDFTVTYVTPTREFVEDQLPVLIKFANNDLKGQFIHPLIKAIILHFWVGLLHPFEDGNGRLARILFYWYMLKQKYWAFSYLSISERILRSPKQYAMAFIYTEQDDGDLNYFIHYNISKIKLARQHFDDYLKRKIDENRRSSEIIRRDHSLNDRQVQLIQHLAKDEQRYTTLREYNNINDNVTKVTAALDLRKLVEKGFLRKVKSGRNVYYYPTNEIRQLIG